MLILPPAGLHEHLSSATNIVDHSDVVIAPTNVDVVIDSTAPNVTCDQPTSGTHITSTIGTNTTNVPLVHNSHPMQTHGKSGVNFCCFCPTR